MIRVWCEHLDYEEARDPEVLDLVEEGGLHPILAVPPEADLDPLAALLEDLGDRGCETAVWPLLEYSAGYWPSAHNAERFERRIWSILEGLEARGVEPDWVAFDFEPALELDDRYADAVTRAFRESLTGRSGDYERAMLTYGSTIEELREAGIRTLSVTSPSAAADLGTERAVWQRSLGLPWAGLDWDRIGVMAYGSMTSAYTGGWLRYGDTRALYYECFGRLRRHFAERAHASLGITGTGVFGDEPAYEDPGDLRRDVAAAAAAGLEDLAIFSLEGILERPSPRRWVEAIRGAEPREPDASWRARAVWRGVDAATRVLGVVEALR